MYIPMLFRSIAVLAGAVALYGQNTPVNSFVVTNDDVAGTNSATFYRVAADGTLGAKAVVKTGGSGIAGGYFAAKRVAVVPSATEVCVFVSDAGSGDIAGIEAQKNLATGNFFGSATDSGATNGIGLAANANYLYAIFSATSTIATFQIQAGCKLNFVSDIFVVGLNGGLVGGMAVRGSMLVATYGDGSIESFQIGAGAPVSNGDAQESTGYNTDHMPNAVDITRDGHYAIFGDASTVTTVEVSDISSGKLAQTIEYSLGTGWNSGNVNLSPDETVLFISNDSSGQVTAAFFDKATGIVSLGCTSAVLKNFYSTWSYAGGIGLQLTSGTGGLLYVPEFGSGGASGIGLVQFASSGGRCTLTETAQSPVADPIGLSALLSVGVYPARRY